jgi:hypothetical protein
MIGVGLTVAHAAITHAQLFDIGARAVLAAADPTGTSTNTNTNTDDDTESKKSGPIGLVLIIVLCVVCYFLFKSMSKHLRSVREGSVPISARSSSPSARTAPPVNSTGSPDHADERPPESESAPAPPS